MPLITTKYKLVVFLQFLDNYVVADYLNNFLTPKTTHSTFKFNLIYD